MPGHAFLWPSCCAVRSDRLKPFSAMAPGLFQAPFLDPHDPSTVYKTRHTGPAVAPSRTPRLTELERLVGRTARCCVPPQTASDNAARNSGRAGPD
jgi:hypothetical protein